MLGWTFCVILGYAGWWLGAKVGLFTALVVSCVGSALGLYAGRKLQRNLLG
jgi:hypothetical protein